MQQIVITILIVFLIFFIIYKIIKNGLMKKKQNINSDKKRILYIADQDGKYGAPRSMMEMILSLKKKYNIEPIVLTSKYNDVNKFCNDNKIENYVTYHQKYTYINTKNKIKNIIKWFPRYIRYIVGSMISLLLVEIYIDFDQIELIHSNISAVDLGCILAKRHDIKHIMHIREFGEKDFKMKSYRIGYIDFLNECTDMFIAISNAIQIEWEKKGIDKSKIEVVYNGIKTNDIKVKQEYLTNHKMKMLITGSLCEGKGQKKLLQAIAKLPNYVRENIELDIAGDGATDYKQELYDFVDNNNLRECVKFIGYCDNVREQICKYDIGMMCSKAEGFGRVTVEYMTAGICVIASNSGANAEIVEDGKTGFIYDDDSEKSMIDKIVYVYNNRNLLKEIGNNARNKVLERFTTDINSENVFKKYLIVLREEVNV